MKSNEEETEWTAVSTERKTASVIFTPRGGKFHAFCCNMDNCDGRKSSNADRIRAMTDEELARLLASNADCNECRIYSYKDGCMESYDTCVCQWRDWLKQEAI